MHAPLGSLRALHACCQCLHRRKEMQAARAPSALLLSKARVQATDILELHAARRRALTRASWHKERCLVRLLYAPRELLLEPARAQTCLCCLQGVRPTSLARTRVRTAPAPLLVLRHCRRAARTTSRWGTRRPQTHYTPRCTAVPSVLERRVAPACGPRRRAGPGL